MMPQQTQSDTRTSPPATDGRGSGELHPPQDFLDYLKAYAREKPDVAALWCFGIGFVIGWKLKPW